MTNKNEKEFLEKATTFSNVITLLCIIGVLISSNIFVESLLIFFICVFSFCSGFSLSIIEVEDFDLKIKTIAKEDESND